MILCNEHSSSVKFATIYPKELVDTNIPSTPLCHRCTSIHKMWNVYNLASGVINMVWFCKRALDNTIYGQKQAGLEWYDHISDRIWEIGFLPLRGDKFVIIHGKCVFAFYVDDSILMSPEKLLIDNATQKLNALGLKMEDQGYSSDYFGINIKQNMMWALNHHSQNWFILSSRMSNRVLGNPQNLCHCLQKMSYSMLWN